MKLSSLSEIRDCINHWQEIRNDATEVVKYLGNAQSFTYCKKGCKKTDYLHVYPGVHPKTKIFYVFLISKENDRHQRDAKLYKSITQCLVQRSISNDPGTIPEREAKLRIDNWDKYVVEWIKNQINTPNGIFKAFNMPASHMRKCRKYKTFFALKNLDNVSEAGEEYEADLISTESFFRRVSVYYDFVRPVPPFGGGTTKADFYLLS